jgi:hypothetical protein
MSLPALHISNQSEFNAADEIYKIIAADTADAFFYIKINNRKYYISYQGVEFIKINMQLLPSHNYLLVGVNTQTVVIDAIKGRLLFSIGLFSFLQGFEDTSQVVFTIFTELENIVVNKNGLSISESVYHDLEL